MSDVNVDKPDATQNEPLPGEGQDAPVAEQQVASFAELAEQGHTATELDVTASRCSRSRTSRCTSR